MIRHHLTSHISATSLVTPCLAEFFFFFPLSILMLFFFSSSPLQTKQFSTFNPIFLQINFLPKRQAGDINFYRRTKPGEICLKKKKQPLFFEAFIIAKDETNRLGGSLSPGCTKGRQHQLEPRAGGQGIICVGLCKHKYMAEPAKVTNGLRG